MNPSLASPQVTLLTDVGRVRSENQDRCGEFIRANGERLIVVADGMGGHQGGATAALIAVDTMGRVFQESMATGASLLEESIEAANHEICREAEADDQLAGMGSTIVALLFAERDYVAHVGDSRAYRLRDSEFERLTEDHSTVMELVRAGRITEEEAETHPRRNEVLRSLGTFDGVVPEIQEIESRTGDRYLLCSDGLTGVVSVSEIVSMIMEARTPGHIAESLVDQANAAGGPDNVTVALVDLIPTDGAQGLASADSPESGPPGPSVARNPKRLRRLALIAAITTLLLVAASLMFVASSIMSTSQQDVSETPRNGTHEGDPDTLELDPGLP